MPEIQGRVVSDDHTPVAGCRVALFSDQIGVAPGEAIPAAPGGDNGALIELLSGRRLGEATTDALGSFTIRYAEPSARDQPFLLYYLPDALEPHQQSAINPGPDHHGAVVTVLRGRVDRPTARRRRAIDFSRIDEGVSPVGVTHNIYAHLSGTIASGDADIRRQLDEMALRYDEDTRRLLHASPADFGDALLAFDRNERWRRATGHALVQAHLGRWMERAQLAADLFLHTRALVMGLAELGEVATRRIAEGMAQRGARAAESSLPRAAEPPPRIGAAEPPRIPPGSAMRNAPEFGDLVRRGLHQIPPMRTQLAQGPYSNCWAVCIRMIFRDLGVELGERMGTNPFTIHGAGSIRDVLAYLRLMMANKIPGLINSAGRYELAAIQSVVQSGTTRVFLAVVWRQGWRESHAVIVDAVMPMVIEGERVMVVVVRDPNGFTYFQRVAQFLEEYAGEGIVIGI